jgi:hypothetical protein
VTSKHAYRIVVDGECGAWLARSVGSATLVAASGATTIDGFLDDPGDLLVLTSTLADLGLEIRSAKLL